MTDRQVPEDARRTIRLGCVSFLNTKPLIYGLETAAGVDLLLDVPSRLLEGLRQGAYDVALLPVIDYQRMAGLRLMTCGGIASDGPTLTVRIFSRVPIGKIATLACDTDSHTSVGLARILLGQRWGIRPSFVDLQSPRRQASEAMLLIGDKVVCEAPTGYEHQLDLGEAWKELTGLPFAFAAWMVRPGAAIGDLARQLEASKRAGLQHVDEIVRRYAVPRGWPAELARHYLTRNLTFDIGPRELEAMGLFYQLASKWGVLEGEVRPLDVYKGG